MSVLGAGTALTLLLGLLVFGQSVSAGFVFQLYESCRSPKVADVILKKQNKIQDLQMEKSVFGFSHSIGTETL